MILTSYLLQAALAPMLAFLGGAFLRNVRGLGDDGTAFGRSRDRLLGLALYVASVFAGALAGSRLAGYPGPAGEPEVALPFAAPVLAALWLGAVGLGLRRMVAVAAVRRMVIAAVVALVLMLAGANSRLTGADIFMLVALAVWLGSTLIGFDRARK